LHRWFGCTAGLVAPPGWLHRRFGWLALLQYVLLAASLLCQSAMPFASLIVGFGLKYI
jgi:hypothetical protein